MKLKIVVIFLLTSLMQGCARDEQQFNQVCGYFKELESRLDQSDMTPSDRSVFILEKVTNNLSENSNARIAWEAIAYAEASQRYELFIEAAKSTGVKNWQCTAMQKLVGTLE